MLNEHFSVKVPIMILYAIFIHLFIYLFLSLSFFKIENQKVKINWNTVEAADVVAVF